MLSAAVYQDCLKSDAECTTDILVEAVADHQRFFGGLSSDPFEGGVERARVRFPDRKRRRCNEHVDLILKSQHLQFLPLMILFTVGEDRDSEPGGAGPPERRDGIVE